MWFSVLCVAFSHTDSSHSGAVLPPKRAGRQTDSLKRPFELKAFPASLSPASFPLYNSLESLSCFILCLFRQIYSTNHWFSRQCMSYFYLDLFNHAGIQKCWVISPLYASDFCRCWGYSSYQDRRKACPQEAYVLVKDTDSSRVCLQIYVRW